MKEPLQASRSTLAEAADVSSADPSPASHRPPGAGALLTLINGVLAGVGGVYVSTHSIVITVIAVATAASVALAVLFSRR